MNRREERTPRTVQTEVTIALAGDWSITGIGNHLAELRELLNELPRSVGRLTVDCASIEAIDLYGYQLLTVWICCLQDNDISLQFQNLPEEVGKALGRIGADNRASGLHFMGLGHGKVAHGFGQSDITF